MKEYTGQEKLLSTGEFVSQILPNKEQRDITERGWVSLRDKLLGHLQEEWPILINALQGERLADVKERMYQSRLKYEMNNLEDAIKDAGVSCESLLQILHSVYGRKELSGEMVYHDFLCTLRDVIIEKFGEDVYKDLDLIREWRNNVVHPPVVKPDETTALRVVRKAELFFELFNKKVLFAPRTKQK